MCIFFGLKPRLQESSDSFGLVNWWCAWEPKKTGHQLVNHLGWLDAEMASCVLKTLKLKVFIPPTTALKTRASKGKIEFEAWLLWWKQVFFSPKIQGQQPQDNKRAVVTGTCLARVDEGEWKMWHTETFPWMKPKHPTSKHPFLLILYKLWLVRFALICSQKSAAKIAATSSQSPSKPRQKHIILVARTGFQVETLTFQLRSYWESKWNLSKLKILLPQTVIFFEADWWPTPARTVEFSSLVFRPFWEFDFLSKWEVHGLEMLFGIERMVQRDA